MSDEAALKARLEALEAENQRLTTQLAQRARVERVSERTLRWGARALLGRSFNRAARRLSEAAESWQKGEREHAPIPETVDFFSAAFARFVRVGLFGLLFAILPAAVLIIQTVLLLFQNAKLDTQNHLAREQVVAALVEQREMVIKESSELSIQMGRLRDQHGVCQSLREMGQSLKPTKATDDPVEELALGAVDLLPNINRRKMAQQVKQLRAYYSEHHIELAARCVISDDVLAPLEGLRQLPSDDRRALEAYTSKHYQKLCMAMDDVVAACGVRQSRLKSIRSDLDRRHRSITELLMETP
ncbi:MAG: hypothetical protein ACE366_15920 [Bradymonadia bacterium]